MKYNFDRIIDRSNTHALKVDLLPKSAPEDALSLWVADMDFPCAQPILEALHQRVNRQIFGYTMYDNDRLKNAVYQWFHKRFAWDIDKSWIFFSPGVVPAISFLINILTEENDGVIIQRPVYYPFTSSIEANRRKVVNSPLLRTEDSYIMDYEDLERKFADPIVKGMILCSPHNPVGRVWTEEELKQLVEIAARYDKWIIADEIHCDLTRKGIVHHPLLKVAPEYQERIITCTAPSKTFNLAGMQLSNIIIPNQEYQKLWKEFAGERMHISICNPFGLEAVVAAYTEGEEWLEQVLTYLDGNIKFAEDFIKEHLPEAQVIRCEGTYLLWIDVRNYCNDTSRLKQIMLQAGLVLDEGYIFGIEGSGYERINIATPRANIEECMLRLKKGLHFPLSNL